MIAKINILDTTITPSIKPYPESDRIVTSLYNALICVDDKNEDFYLFQQQGKKLSPSVQELEITNHNKTIALPQEISRNLLSYLKSPKYWEYYDCHKFIFDISHRPQSQLIYEYNDENTRPWDIGLIFNNDQAIIHRQIYLNEWLFLSKWWHLWPLIISTNDEMIKLWWWKKTMIQL